MELEELVSQDSYARLEDVFVDSLPLHGLSFTYAAHEKQGSPPYHPSILLNSGLSMRNIS